MTSSIWGRTDSTLYLSTTSDEFFGGLNSWAPLPTPSDHTYIEYVRGSGPNNIFWIGHFGLIIHGNGNSWHRYDQFYRKPAGDKFKSLWAFEDAVFIVGRAEDSRGIIYRGYRSE